MKIILLTVGKTTNPQLLKLQEEYQNRLKFYVPYELQIIPELKNTKNLSVNEQMEKEADLILKQLDAADEVILLDERGKQFTSVAFSDFISKKNAGFHKTHGFCCRWTVWFLRTGLQTGKRIGFAFSHDLFAPNDPVDFCRTIVPGNDHSER